MSAAVDGDAVALHPYLLIFPPVADVLPGGVVVAAVYLSYPRSIEVHRTLALRLLRRILRGLNPGLPDVAVVLCPLSSTLQRVAHLLDRALQIVELILVEYQRVHKRVSRWLVLGQVLVDYRRYPCWVIQLTKTIMCVLQIPDVVPLVHPVRRPRYQGELLPVVVEPLDLGEHTLRARFDELLLKSVGGHDLIVDHPHDHRTRLDA